ncbi:MAG: metallophosphoesterase, partial [Verrucomicrobia bacterium]|nr:metallophosphoesterase [Verrucomicrobiota bacterium]
YTPDNLSALVDTMKDLAVSHVLITGDLSCTSSEGEFEMAQEFVESLKSNGMNVFAVPGNHDQYTKQAYRDQIFYDYFDSSFSDATAALPPTMSLKKDKVTARFLGQQWWLVGIDTALATPLLSSSGNFSQEIEKNLEKVLSAIPSDHNILLMNHFPIFELESPRNKLIRKDALRALLLKFPNVRFYLHGHTHRHCIADLRPNQLPVVLDSGSTAHKTIGSWNLLEITKEGCRVQPYRWKQGSHEGTWTPDAEHLFKW